MRWKAPRADDATLLCKVGQDNDIVDLIAERLREKEAHLARAQAINEAWEDLPDQEASESTLVGRFGDEQLLLQLAAQLEQARPWSKHKGTSIYFDFERGGE